MKTYCTVHELILSTFTYTGQGGHIPIPSPIPIPGEGSILDLHLIPEGSQSHIPILDPGMFQSRSLYCRSPCHSRSIGDIIPNLSNLLIYDIDIPVLQVSIPLKKEKLLLSCAISVTISFQTVPVPLNQRLQQEGIWRKVITCTPLLKVRELILGLLSCEEPTLYIM